MCHTWANGQKMGRENILLGYGIGSQFNRLASTSHQKIQGVPPGEIKYGSWCKLFSVYVHVERLHNLLKESNWIWDINEQSLRYLNQYRASYLKRRLFSDSFCHWLNWTGMTVYGRATYFLFLIVITHSGVYIFFF